MEGGGLRVEGSEFSASAQDHLHPQRDVLDTVEEMCWIQLRCAGHSQDVLDIAEGVQN